MNRLKSIYTNHAMAVDAALIAIGMVVYAVIYIVGK